MPYKSQAQAGYFHTHKKQLAKQGVDVAEWDRATKGKHLPARAAGGGAINAALNIARRPRQNGGEVVSDAEPDPGVSGGQQYAQNLGFSPSEQALLDVSRAQRQGFQNAIANGTSGQLGQAFKGLPTSYGGPKGPPPSPAHATDDLPRQAGGVSDQERDIPTYLGPYLDSKADLGPTGPAFHAYAAADRRTARQDPNSDVSGNNYGYAKTFGEHANWPKFEAEARPSTNVTDMRNTPPFGEGYGGGDTSYQPTSGPVATDNARGGSATGEGRIDHALQLARHMAAGGFDPMGKPGASAMGSVFEGPIRTGGAGRTDVNKHDVASGSYVVPADAVSISGDGNTEAGFKFFKDFFRKPVDLTGGMKVTPGTPMKASGVQKPGLKLAPHHMGKGKAEGGIDGGEGGPVPIIDAGGEIVVPPRLLAAKFGNLDHAHNTMDEIVKLLRSQEMERLKTAPPPKK